MNPVIYQDNNIVIVNQPVQCSMEQLQNRYLILCTNKFVIQQYNNINNNWINIQDVNLINYVINKLFGIENDGGQLFILHYDAQNNTIINCRNNEIYNNQMEEFGRLCEIYNYIIQRNQNLQNSKEILYEDENLIISNEVKIETQKQNYILHDYILYSLNVQTNQYDIITDDNIKLKYIPQIIEFVKGNIRQKAIKEQIQNLISSTNKIIIHIDGKGKYTDLRKNTEIDKKSNSYKYVQSIFKCININSTNSKSSSSKSSLQAFHNALTKITLSASDNEHVFRHLVMTIFLILSDEKTRQKLLDVNTTREEGLKAVEELIKNDNPSLYDMTILPNSKFRNIDLCEILEIAENGIKNDESFISELYDKGFNYTKKTNTDKNNVWTPNYISNLMAMLMKPFIEEIYKSKINQIQNTRISVLDCACGCNNLFRAIKRMIQNIPFEFTGCEILPDVAKLAELDSKITKLNSNIISLDFFKFSELNPNIVYDVSICNPPYTKSKKIEKEIIRPPIDFVIESMRHSKVGCYIFPAKDFDMNNSKLKGKIDILRKECTIHKIIRFNSSIKVFSTAGITDIIILLLTNDNYIQLDCEKEKIDIQYFELDGKKEDYTSKTVKKGAHEVELNEFGIKVFNEFLKDISSEDSEVSEVTEDSEKNENSKKTGNSKNISEVLLKMTWPQNIDRITFEQPDMCNVIARRYCNYFSKIKEVDKDVKMKKVGKIEEMLKIYNDAVDDLKKKFEENSVDNIQQNINVNINEMSEFKDIIINFIKYGTELLLTENSTDKMKEYEYDEVEFIQEITKLNAAKNMYFRLDNNRFKYVNFLNLFDVVSGPSHYTNEGKSTGDYPLVCASKYNNGIKVYLDTYDYEAGFYTLAKDGDSQGFIFKQNEPFSKVPTVWVLNNKSNIDDLNLLLVSIQLNSMFNWSNKLSIERIKNLKIWVYV